LERNPDFFFSFLLFLAGKLPGEVVVIGEVEVEVDRVLGDVGDARAREEAVEARYLPDFCFPIGVVSFGKF